MLETISISFCIEKSRTFAAQLNNRLTEQLQTYYNETTYRMRAEHQ